MACVTSMPSSSTHYDFLQALFNGFAARTGCVVPSCVCGTWASSMGVMHYLLWLSRAVTVDQLLYVTEIITLPVNIVFGRQLIWWEKTLSLALFTESMRLVMIKRLSFFHCPLHVTVSPLLGCECARFIKLTAESRWGNLRRCTYSMQLY